MGTNLENKKTLMILRNDLYTLCDSELRLTIQTLPTLSFSIISS